jgi:hypothetical protein
VPRKWRLGKAAIAELLEKDPDANAPVIAQHLQPLGFDGGLTIIKNYLRALRKKLRGPPRLLFASNLCRLQTYRQSRLLGGHHLRSAS